jgi:hypothetical protein
MHSIIYKQKVLAGAALSLILILLTVTQAPTAHALPGRYPDLNMTYGLQPACEPLRPAILDAITAWVNWLPGSSWTQTDPANAEITFVCEVPYNPPTCGGGLSLACAMTVGPVNGHDTIVLSITGLATSFGAYSTEQADRDIIAHEIGHTFGLSDGAGSHACPGESLMTNALGCDPPPSTDDGTWRGIPSPGEDLLAVLRATYGITTDTTTTAETTICHEPLSLLVATDKTNYTLGELVIVAVTFARLNSSCADTNEARVDNIRLEVNGTQLQSLWTQNSFNESITFSAQAPGSYVFNATEWLNGTTLELENHITIIILDPNTLPSNSTSTQLSSTVSPSAAATIMRVILEEKKPQ